MAIEVKIGDVVRLKKPHPCGSYEWIISRIGADIGLHCNTCKHRVLLTRSLFEKRFKDFVSRIGRRTAASSGERPVDIAGC